jgi:hypothetical protein
MFFRRCCGQPPQLPDWMVAPVVVGLLLAFAGFAALIVKTLVGR